MMRFRASSFLSLQRARAAFLITLLLQAAILSDRSENPVLIISDVEDVMRDKSSVITYHRVKHRDIDPLDRKFSRILEKQLFRSGSFFEPLKIKRCIESIILDDGFFDLSAAKAVPGFAAESSALIAKLVVIRESESCLDCADTQ